uniref:hypothetical protein n=1 Tax=uncultured Pseudomonas sp. TaxID=114707 RepID=UPI002589DF76
MILCLGCSLLDCARGTFRGLGRRFISRFLRILCRSRRADCSNHVIREQLIFCDESIGSLKRRLVLGG